MLPHSAAGKRRLKLAKDSGLYTDMTYGRKLKALLIMDDGQLIGCGVSTKTMIARLNALNDRKEENPHEEDDPTE